MILIGIRRYSVIRQLSWPVTLIVAEQYRLIPKSGESEVVLKSSTTPDSCRFSALEMKQGICAFLNFLQIWIAPDRQGGESRYGQ